MSATTPVSDRKLNANRQNARKSTGPGTNQGKERSSKNATTHGLYAATLLLPGESEARYHGLRHLLLGSMNPQDALELFFAEQVITSAWRLSRVNDADFYNHHMESARLQAEHEQFKNDHPDATPDDHDDGNGDGDGNDYATDQDGDPDADEQFPPLLPGFVIAASLRRALDGGDTPGAARTTAFERLLTAQHRLMSHVYRAMNELRNLQKERRKDEHQAGIPHHPTCPFVPPDAYEQYAELGKILEEEDEGGGPAEISNLKSEVPPAPRNTAQHGATTLPSAAQNEPTAPREADAPPDPRFAERPPAPQNEPTTHAAKLHQACQSALPTIPDVTEGGKT